MSRQLTLSALLSSLMMLGFALASVQAPVDMATSGGSASYISVASDY